MNQIYWLNLPIIHTSLIRVRTRPDDQTKFSKYTYNNKKRRHSSLPNQTVITSSFTHQHESLITTVTLYICPSGFESPISPHTISTSARLHKRHRSYIYPAWQIAPRASHVSLFSGHASYEVWMRGCSRGEFPGEKMPPMFFLFFVLRYIQSHARGHRGLFAP